MDDDCREACMRVLQETAFGSPAWNNPLVHPPSLSNITVTAVLPNGVVTRRQEQGRPQQASRSARSQTATAATTLPAGRVGGDGGDILDAADLEAGAGEGAQRGLGAGARGLGAGAAGGAQLDVQRVHAQLLAADGDVLGGKHSRVGGGLVAIGLDLHATGHADQGLLAGQIGDVHEGVVEGGEDVGNAKDQLALPAREETKFGETGLGAAENYQI